MLDQPGDLQPLRDEGRHDLAQAVVPLMCRVGREDHVGLDVRAAVFPGLSRAATAATQREMLGSQQSAPIPVKTRSNCSPPRADAAS